jgi:hypothetical protein
MQSARSFLMYVLPPCLELKAACLAYSLALKFNAVCASEVSISFWHVTRCESLEECTPDMSEQCFSLA